MRRALIIVGKPPAPGQTKTRLAPPLSADGAAALYRGFLLDSVSLGLGLGWEQVTVVHPRAGGEALAALLPGQIRLLEQPGQGLADALPYAFARHLAGGFDRVVLIGSDNPTLPRGLIEQACAALDDHDLAIGPSADGGYYLVGLREAHLGVFDAIEWSTSRVYFQTLARADQLDLRVCQLPEWYDVDEPADLARLQHELATSADDVAPHTRAALQRLYSGAGWSGGTSSVGVRPERSA
ncbi:MAG TPA: TIGR04282 family arsenosugar biosynthesis glycosyltransferase [Chloroflexota bacterium]|nr:TIGR04282 family arsenosugar biosynthesis glycosyltransferase [Chloroflexota bacterium]